MRWGIVIEGLSTSLQEMKGEGSSRKECGGVGEAGERVPRMSPISAMGKGEKGRCSSARIDTPLVGEHVIRAVLKRLKRKIRLAKRLSSFSRTTSMGAKGRGGNALTTNEESKKRVYLNSSSVAKRKTSRLTRPERRT